jgi:hypothetical protein
MRSLMAAVVLASFIGAVWATAELTARNTRLAMGANRCPQFAAGEPLVTAIYHANGAVACHYSVPKRRMVEHVYPTPITP